MGSGNAIVAMGAVTFVTVVGDALIERTVQDEIDGGIPLDEIAVIAEIASS